MLLPRRQFLKTAALGTAGLLLSRSAFAQALGAADGKPLKVGVVGCGGRGMGAATDALEADSGVIVWALADVFEERMTEGVALLVKDYGEARVQVPAERRFAGLDGYKRLMQSGVDVVLLCSPPVFRPQHIRSAVEAGVHLFAEKPVAVDVPGVLSVLESAKLAREKNLLAFNGFCWRFDNGCRSALAELKQGTFGKPLSFTGLYYTTPPKTPMSDASRPAGMTDVEWAIKNWTGWNWLSGGSFVEQIVHTIDLMCWSFDEQMPLAAIGSGGRAQRRDTGDVWDHYQVTYELPNRVRANINSRQWTNCYCDISDRIVCEKGVLVTPYRPRFEGAQRWRFTGTPNNMFRQTHKELFALLRAGKAEQMLEAAASKTLIAILGRTAAQTGQRVTWEEILKDTTSLMPAGLTLESKLPPAVIPTPGQRS